MNTPFFAYCQHTSFTCHTRRLWGTEITAPQTRQHTTDEGCQQSPHTRVVYQESPAPGSPHATTHTRLVSDTSRRTHSSTFSSAPARAQSCAGVTLEPSLSLYTGRASLSLFSLFSLPKALLFHPNESASQRSGGSATCSRAQAHTRRRLRGGPDAVCAGGHMPQWRITPLSRASALLVSSTCTCPLRGSRGGRQGWRGQSQSSRGA